MKKYILLTLLLLLFILLYNWFPVSQSEDIQNKKQPVSLPKTVNDNVWTYEKLGLSEFEALGGNYMFTGSGNLNDTTGYIYGSFASGNYIQLLHAVSGKTMNRIALPAVPIEVQPFGKAWFVRNLDSLYYISDNGNVLIRRSCPKGNYTIDRTVVNADTSEVFILANGNSLLSENNIKAGWLQSDGAYIWVDKMKDGNRNTVFISRVISGKTQSVTLDFGVPTGVVYNWGTVDGWVTFTVEKIINSSPLKIENNLFLIPADNFSTNVMQMATIPAKQSYITKQNVSLMGKRIYIRIPQSEAITLYTIHTDKLADTAYLSSVFK